MVIISVSKKTKFRVFSSAQFRYALTFLLITSLVLAFLNLYCARENESLFCQNKLSALQSKADIIVRELSAEEQENRSAVPNIVRDLGFSPERFVIVDAQNAVISDSAQAGTPLPDELSDPTAVPYGLSQYESGVITTVIVVPIGGNGAYGGCRLYLQEKDSSDGHLLKSLHTNILSITIMLEVVVIVLSVYYVNRYTFRLKKIMASMHVIQEGDFSHKIQMGGHDELSFLADEFNYLTDRLQTSENKRRQFVSDASHELKTPLASIKLLSDSILQYDMDMATVREFAGDIGSEADRLTRMTNKLLALTKGEADGENADVEIVYMAPTVERVVKMLDAIAQKNAIRVELDLHNDSTILIQEDDLYQITYNLVENGIKYNVPGGKLSISLHRQEDMAILRICDTGVGIPPDALSHVFERFYRVDKARSRKSGGSGLGLSIVRSMVERNNGEIHLQSTVGKGTTFTVAFPCFDISEEEIDSISSEETE